MNYILKNEMAAHNGRFGASGGVSRPTLECRTATSALVQTAVESPACRQAAGTLGASAESVMTEYRELKCSVARQEILKYV